MRRAAVLVALGAALLLAACGGAHPSMSGSVRRLGPTPAGRSVDASLVLRVRHPAALRRFLAGLSGHHHFLTAAAYGRRFGPTAAGLARARAVLRAAGVHVVGSYPQRTALRVRGSARALDRLFSTRLVDFADAGGHRWHEPAARPRVPAGLAGAVTAVADLNSRPDLRPLAVPAGGLTPQDTATAYDIAPLHRQGFDGRGQTIAIVSFDAFTDADLGAFDARFGITSPPPERVPVRGGTSPGNQQAETDLDVDVVRSIAPRAHILDYEAQNGFASLGDIVDKIVADGRADIVTDSWGRCDLHNDPGRRAREEASFRAAAARGITIFAATGDQGAYDCQASDPTSQQLSVDWPAASPNVIGVGGTRLSVRRDGSYLDEAGWEDVLAGQGGGGGPATVEPRPPWQAGPGVRNADSNGHRQVPDVAGPADPDSGFAVAAEGAFHQIGGTSAAAPFWAASTLLIEGYARRHGVRSLAPLAPALYGLAAGRPPFPAFHDVVRGGNRHFAAGPGWDYATGLGSPDVYGLARDLAARLGR
jgi:subtilase family serine protease